MRKIQHRDTHYFLWFIFFGVLAGLIHYVNSPVFDPESAWLTVTGLLGLLFGASWVARGRLSRWYDLAIGVIFTVVGAIGILLGFHLPIAGLTSDGALLGLNLGVLPSLIHGVLGVTSLNHAIHER